MKKTVLLLMLIAVLSKSLGFIRDITLSYFYGASSISDAYLISLSVPVVIFTFVGIAISTGYIPMYTRIEKELGEKEGIKYTNNLVNTLIIVCTAIVFLGLLFTKEIIGVFASGFKGETLALAVQFTRISLLSIYFIGLVSIFSGFLQLKGNYTLPAIIGFPLNFFIILSIVLSFTRGTDLLPLGVVLAYVSQFVLLLPSVFKKGYRYELIANIKYRYIIQMAYLTLPVMIGGSINRINALVDRTIASQLAVGGISALSYSNKLDEFIQGIFVAPLCTTMYPVMTRMAVTNDLRGLRKAVSETISSVSILLIPASIGTMIFAEPVVRFLFLRGAFDLNAVYMTSNALFFYSIGMVSFGFREILSRAFYSLQDTKTPMINATVAMILNISLNIILSKLIGIGGLALATSISGIFCTILLFISFRKKIGLFEMRNTFISIMKITVASVLMGIIAKLAFDILLGFLNQGLSLVFATIIGALIYFVIIYLMRVEEIKVLVNIIKARISKCRKKEIL